MAKPSSTSDTSGLLGLLVFAGFIAGIVALFMWEDLTFARTANAFQAGAFWIIPLTVTILAIVAIFVFFEDMLNVVLLALVLAVIAGLFFTVFNIVRHGYETRLFYLENVVEVEGSTPSFNERAAFNVATAQAAGNLGEIRGTIEETSYLSDEDVFSSLVRRNGTFTGYSAISVQTVELTGQASSKSCEFSSEARDRLNGIFHASLEREIAHLKTRAIVTDEDAYGYCDGDTPMVVVPLKKLEGWFPAVEVPAGVAVYNGKTGDLEVRDSGKGLPGPVFPISLAAEIRESTAAMGGYWDYVKNRVGYAAGEFGNSSELALSNADGNTPSYATPLSARGRSTAIVALGVIDADALKEGSFPEYTIYKLTEPRKANTAIEDRLKSDYGDLPDWAAGMEIFEITPVSSTEWVASMGREQNVNYRVRVMADGSSCLETAEGEEIRCGKVTGLNGNSPGVALAPAEGTTATPPVVNLPDSPAGILELSDEELVTLQSQLNTEILKRLNEK